jgi:2-hydroxychromene-2-carboxylate isomerase
LKFAITAEDHSLDRRWQATLHLPAVKTVDFYFDYLSPYAYLAALAAPDLCARHEARLQFRPVLFAGLLDHWGQRGPAEIAPKGFFALRSCLRYARQRGIPLRMPTYHPFNPLTALRATLAAGADEDRPRAVRALFELGWAEGRDLGDAAEIERALTAAGLDGRALVAAASDGDIKAALRKETEAAIAEGVFGIPTMIVDGELFWGLDQLEYLELFLEGRDPIAGVDLSELVSKGSTARRPRAE